MDVKILSNSELMVRFGKLVQTERKITHLVLECIAEIDCRKIYLERAYPSLYEFLVKEFGYSPSSAVRRIESARLLRELPEMSEKIEAGALNLSQLSKVQQAIRTVQKIEDRTMDAEEKRELLGKIEYTTQNQTELILAQELSLPFVTEQREQIHRDESVTLSITFSKEQFALLQQVQDLISHNVPTKKWAEVMTYLAQQETKRRTLVKRSTRASQKSSSTSKTEISGSERKAIRTNLRKSIFANGNCCEYQDPVTKKICGGTRFLQIDHIQPVWAGGDNSSENLRVLCARHNSLKYAKESGQHPLRR
ncbi:HNH endonuclease signature motif containing protein [Bdellovibrio svalbardensis]|uniref:HNH endonuclease n=1 Tax=Bdellovibrio svalbardensis TaxID=2972972 RepID=A0ABT6DPT8_9BACT|nr:HNH endonuclease signature motif containing protein [Bdellovibrio svalbardensis]MDG0817939.1 HNH endonuclease [Bdellovibrio svalbardensis]